MIRIFDIALKDLTQLVRERKTFLFLLVMPVLFTLLFGYAFGSNASDERLPVGFLDQDGTWLSRRLGELWGESEVIRLESGSSPAALEARVAGEQLPAAVIIPPGYSHALLAGKRQRLVFIGDTGSTTGTTIESEVLSTALKLESAVQTAAILEDLAGDQAPFEYSFDQALEAWQDPPIRVRETTSSAIPRGSEAAGSMAQTSPGMMLQFAIASLLNCATVFVTERKTRVLARLLTTATARVHILAGHYLGMLALILVQFLLLMGFGQIILKVNYLAQPAATGLVAFAAAACIAALGLLIGVVAKSEEQAIIISLVCMFLLSGLGGAWLPLDLVGETFQIIGHLTPVAWAMDGFKNITIRGFGLSSVLLPAAALAAYGLLFASLAAWKFKTE